MLSLLATVSVAWAAPEGKFYRIVDGPNPGPRQAAIDRFHYGAEILYTGDVKGEGPVRVEGTVWHSNLKEARYFLGTRNPVIQERELMKLIEDNKWEEAKLLREHVPDAFPRTENMADVVRGANITAARRVIAIRKVGELLRERYPNGFFLKNVSGFDSNGTLPTEKTDFMRSYEGYVRELKPEAERILARTGNPDDIHFELKERPFYEGRVLDAILEDPSRVIVQEKIRARIGGVQRTQSGRLKTLVEEYRVHVVEGRVLEGATLNRWEDARNVSPEVLREAEVFTQAVVNRLPPRMRRMCFGIDVIRTESGRFQIIELNVGGESGYLYPETDAWVTQLLAERYRGTTPLQREIRRIERARTLGELERRLEAFLRRPELVEPLVDPELGTPELMARVKDRVLADVRRAPRPDVALEGVYLIRKFRLGELLNAGEVELLAGILRQTGHSVTEARQYLGLAADELLFYGPAEGVRFLHGIRYDDAAVLGKVETLARERVRSLRIDRGDASEVRRVVREVVGETVLTRGQVRARPELAALVTHDASAALGESARLLYRGGQRSLVAEVVRLLVRR